MLDLVIQQLMQMGIGIASTIIIDEQTSEFQVLMAPDEAKRDRTITVQCVQQPLIHREILASAELQASSTKDMTAQILGAQKKTSMSVAGAPVTGATTKMGYCFQFAFQFPFPLQPDKLPDLLRLTCFLNNSLNILGFQLDEVQKVLLYRSTGFFNSHGVDLCISHLSSAVFFIETYYSLFDRINNTPLTFYSWLQDELMPTLATLPELNPEKTSTAT